jgi:hypothetical protein
MISRQPVKIADLDRLPECLVVLWLLPDLLLAEGLGE